MVWALSKLDEGDIDKIRDLEQDLGVQLLCFSDYDLDLADLSEEEIKKIQNLEEKLEASLIAISK